MATELDRQFFERNTLTVARDLLGKQLHYRGCSGVIVETEAYRDDPASHAITRPKKGVMLWQTYGCVYIYLIYGMYHCLNFTTEKDGVGAVLIRAIEPLTGLQQMETRRAPATKRNLSNGPGKLFKAFGFDPDHHGDEVGHSEIQLRADGHNGNFDIGTSSRIGISKAQELQWRFFVRGNPYLSR